MGAVHNLGDVNRLCRGAGVFAMRDDATKRLVETARGRALAFITADSVLQSADQAEVGYCLGGILRMQVKAGERDVTTLANLAVRKLRHREQARLAAASIYARHGRSWSR
jgi:hypothetical protein